MWEELRGLAGLWVQHVVSAAGSIPNRAAPGRASCRVLLRENMCNFALSDSTPCGAQQGRTLGKVRWHERNPTLLRPARPPQAEPLIPCVHYSR